jgi:hypothetical protein
MIVRFLWGFLLFFLTISSVFAQSNCNDDCCIYGGQSKDGYVQRVMTDIKPTFYKTQDLERALEYIQGSCCEWKTADALCSKAQKMQTKYYAQSLFMFDQLVSVGMRKIDAFQDHCDTLGVVCHPLALEWRKEITKIAESREWFPPSQMQATFQKFRWKTPQAYLTETGTVSYIYNQMCREAEDIYFKIWSPATATSAPMQDSEFWWQTRIQRCHALIVKRYQQESEYVRTLQVEKWTKYYLDNLDTYINKYFVQNRGMTLLDTFEAINNCFTPVLKRVDRTVNCCMRGQK